MKELVEGIDKHLRYEKHEMQEEVVEIYVASKRDKAVCPYCGRVSTKVHSEYERSLQDLPISGKRVRLRLRNKKYFCQNTGCPRKTFGERFTFYEAKATKTTRLQEEILRVSLTQSSISATRYLRGSVANVGKSTICNLLKKMRNSDQ